MSMSISLFKKEEHGRKGEVLLVGNVFIAVVETKHSHYEQSTATLPEAMQFLHSWGIDSPKSKALQGYFTEYEEAVMFLTGGSQ
jgi:hypothetical protein